MMIATDATTIERDTNGRILPIRPADSRAVSGERSPSVRRGEEGQSSVASAAVDTGKLERWQQGLSQVLEQHEREQEALAPERAYVAAGRKHMQSVRFNVLNSEDAASSPGLFAAAQAGSAAVPAATAAAGATISSGAVSQAERLSAPGQPLRSENTSEQAGAARSGGGLEVRSAERTYLGSLAGGGDSPEERSGSTTDEHSGTGEMGTSFARDAEGASAGRPVSESADAPAEITPEMRLAHRASVAYARVSGARMPVPLAHGRVVSMAV